MGSEFRVCMLVQIWEVLMKYLTLATAPIGDFLELDRRPGVTFYKFAHSDCGAFKPDSSQVKLGWSLAAITKVLENERPPTLRIILKHVRIDLGQCNYMAHVVHPYAFISERRKFVVALDHEGALLAISRLDHRTLDKPGLRLLRPNGNGVDMHL